MSKESVQFVEMVRQATQQVGYPMYCQSCGRETRHVYIGTRFNRERYQCPVCGLIKDVVVR